MLRSLGYIGIESTDLDQWSRYGGKLLGMQPVPISSGLIGLRMDERNQRLLVRSGTTDSLRYIGWEVADAAALAQMAARIEAAGFAIAHEPSSLTAERGVAELISCNDPAGNRIELFWGGEIAAEPFQPGRAISGFRTGKLGLGHIVLTVTNIEDVMPFYCDVLGFRLSDYALRPFKAYFFHLNSRHHSFAMVETGQNGIHHLMVELNSLDDVGQGYDLAQLDPEQIGVTLGRHSNDLMTSFYVKSPAGFMIEYGWGGRSIDPARWQAFEYTYGPSLWGHERSWLTPPRQKEARDLRIATAAFGIREKLRVQRGSYMSDETETPEIDDSEAARKVAEAFRAQYHK